MALDEPETDEVAISVNGIDVLIADEVKGYADRSTIDYVDGPDREGFTIGVAGRAGC